jgi:hypothetical protein
VLSTRRERREEGFGLCFVGKISGVTMNGEPRSCAFSLQLIEPLASPRDKNERVRMRCELAGKLATESRRSTRDESGATLEEVHAAGVLSDQCRVTSEKSAAIFNLSLAHYHR